MNLVDTGRERAETLLLANGSDLVLVGSNEAYRQVWARDSMLCSLGLLVTNHSEGREIPQTPCAYQSPLGKLPHNVGVARIPDPALVAHGGRLEGFEGEGVLDTAHAGCVDGNLWYILGYYAYFAVTNDRAFLLEAAPNAEADG